METAAQIGSTTNSFQPGLDAKSWVVLQTRFRFEKKVAAQLAGKGIEVFLPMRRENHSWSDRRKTVEVPLFPGYVFVHSAPSLALRLLVLQTAGVMGFVSSAGTAALVPVQQMKGLQLLVTADAPFSLHPFLQAGTRARIRGGCLDGLEGLVPQAGTNKLVISIESIQRSLAVEFQNHEVEVI
jgi:transcription antitermination factor NusG